MRSSTLQSTAKMYKKIDIENWDRKAQYYFFKDYDNPFFNLCTEVDVTNLLKYSRENGLSFFITSMFASQKAVNGTENFRLRIKDGSVILYDKVDGGSTVLNPDNTFSFCYFEYHETFDLFGSGMNAALQKLRKDGNIFDPHDDKDDLIHYSVIPWIAFSGLGHPRKFKTNDSIPKIVFGKYHKKHDKMVMPLSIDVHHSLMDAWHISQYLQLFQEILNGPELHYS